MRCLSSSCSALCKSVTGYVTLKADCAFRNWAVAVVRYVYLMKGYDSNDQTWLVSKILLWSIVEINTGLICACVPTLKPFFREVVARNLVAKSWLNKWKFDENEDAPQLGLSENRMEYKFKITPNGKIPTRDTSDISLGRV